MEYYICDKCNGSGRIKKFCCPKCKGEGKLNWLEQIFGKEYKPQLITNDEELKEFFNVAKKYM